MSGAALESDPKITYCEPGMSIYGIVNTAMPRYSLVQLNHASVASAADELILASTRGFYVLEQQVVAANADLLSWDVFDPHATHVPVKEGETVSARKARWIEASLASGIILTSGTGAIADISALSMAANDPTIELGVLTGKLRVRQAGDELVGYVRRRKNANWDSSVLVLVVELLT